MLVPHWPPLVHAGHNIIYDWHGLWSNFKPSGVGSL